MHIAVSLLTAVALVILNGCEASYKESTFQKQMHKILADHGLTEVTTYFYFRSSNKVYNFHV